MSYSSSQSHDAVPTIELERNPVVEYFHKLWAILTRPSSFFGTLSQLADSRGRLGVTAPLVFVIVTHWIGSALQYIWQSAVGGVFEPYFRNAFKIADHLADVDNPGRSAVFAEVRERLLHWIMGVGSVILDPFWTLASVLFTSFFVFLGARLLVSPGKDGAPREVNYESALIVVCYGMAPSILSGLPIAGGFIASFLTVIITVVGARAYYRTSTPRAAVIALFPKLLFAGFIFLTFGILLIALLKLIATAF